MAYEPAFFREADGLTPTVLKEFCASRSHEASLDACLDVVKLGGALEVCWLT